MGRAMGPCQALAWGPWLGLLISVVRGSYLRKSYLTSFEQALPVTTPRPASLIGYKAYAFGGQHAYAFGGQHAYAFGGQHYSFSYKEPAEDGSAAGYLTLPDGEDLSERMCNVYEHFFSSPKGDFNSSCLTFVVQLEKAFHYCTLHQETTPPPGTEAADDNEDASQGPSIMDRILGRDEEEPEEHHFSSCVEKERPKTEAQEICRDLYNISAENATDAPGGEPFQQCFKDSDLVQICFGNCGGAEHSRYSFLECIGDCYHFNITEEAKTPIPEPTTPPIPPPLIPIVGHMWNASQHLDNLHGNLRNISKVSHNVTSQWEERFPDRALPTTMPPDLLANQNETENVEDVTPDPGALFAITKEQPAGEAGAGSVGLLTRIRRSLHSMVSTAESGR